VDPILVVEAYSTILKAGGGNDVPDEGFERRIKYGDDRADLQIEAGFLLIAGVDELFGGTVPLVGVNMLMGFGG
jgi:hypothetical protein